MNLSSTYLRAVLVLGLALAISVGSVAAQTVCEPLNFCDRDGDGFVRLHRKCRCTDPEPAGFDCDDSVFSETNNCNGGGGDALTAELDGIFVFDGGVQDFEFLSPGSPDGANTDPITLSRPDDSDCINFPGLCDLAAEWDDVLSVCSELLPAQVDELNVPVAKARIFVTGDAVSVSLRRIIFSNGVELGLALRGTTDGLSVLGDAATYEFDSIGVLATRTAGGKGGRKRCQQTIPLPRPSCLEVNGGGPEQCPSVP